MGRGGIGLGTTKIRSRREDAPPVYTYEAVPGMPLVSTMRLGRGFSGVSPGAHSRDFLVLNYFERGASSLLLGDQEWQIEAGDAYVIAPGEVADASGLEEAEGWSVYLPPDVFGFRAPSAFLSWRAHLLLFPFVRGVAGSAQRLKGPPADRPSWSEHLSALDLVAPPEAGRLPGGCPGAPDAPARGCGATGGGRCGRP